MGSSRLPGKVLEPVLGVPMIGRQLERLHRIKGLSGLVVATSTDPADDPLVDYVAGIGYAVVRGSLDDVLGRFVDVLDRFSPEVVVRLTADCPLVSPLVADLVIESFVQNSPDYASNTLTPTFPDGLDIEVVRADALRWVLAQSTDAAEHEHVTLGVYRRPAHFRLLNVSGHLDYSDLRWTVDNADDLQFVRTVYERLYAANEQFEFEDVLELLQSEPAMSRTKHDAARNAALRGLDTGAMHVE